MDQVISAVSVWVAFPTGNTSAANATLAKWHAQGYRSAVLIDAGQERPDAEIVLTADVYPGFPAAANRLGSECVRAGADVVIVAGDDIDPDARCTASFIGAMFQQRFPDMLGVGQPMGDAYGALAPGMERAAVSPWIGREFIRRAYGGAGPYFTGYRHLYADAELWNVAEKLGVLWQEPTISQYHRHHTRGHADTLPADKRGAIADAVHNDKKLFRARKAAGFPGHEVSDAV